jgi:putative tricarboxylic transport membrane protein
MKTDLALGTATLVLSAAYYSMAGSIPDSQLADAIGPRGLPTTYALMLAALSPVLIIRSLTRKVRLTAVKKPDTTSVRGIRLQPDSRLTIWRVAGMLAIGIIYIVVVPWLGYLLSLAGLIFATIYYQGGAVNRQVAIVALSGAVFCWVLFVLLMRIPQPPGLWPSLL